MDAVLQKFNSVLFYDDPRSADHETLYKNWGKYGNQEERRKEILNLQKGGRNDSLDQFRGILDFSRNTVGNSAHRYERQPAYRPNIYVAGFNKAPPTYKNVLMMSEWMVERPEDFNENWFVVPCPKGIRVLIVSDRGITKLYGKHGQFIKELRTVLPGGNTGDYVLRSGNFSVLDGFYLEKSNTLFVLDLLAWNSQPMTNGEAQFRQFWLQTHLLEIEGLQTISKKNNIKIKLLPSVPCYRDYFNGFMMKYPHFESNFPPLDGLLFYHKLANYSAGQTPLVGWLYPYMVREVLGYDIAVNPIYMRERPRTYIDQATFIQEFTQDSHKKRRNNRNASTSMETETVKEMTSPSAIYLPIGEQWQVSAIKTSGTEFLFEVRRSRHDICKPYYILLYV
ncbi:PREDICTED: snurportin-1 isoform X1 [Papilio xuthus]|uniref:Snurportin-1 n=1 Tax=Papilio xuthus TaxID=66420 RepID=A0AAJ7EHB3_PAPXU|nr:PREDICTED: snurportin-1 isoform X1 [Papilio xuthus]